MAGRFWLKRKTISKRMQAKLVEVKDQIKQRRHDPVPEQGEWLGSVVRGHLAYYAVPGNTEAVAAFRKQVIRHWFKALRGRSQRTRVDWDRMNLYVKRWIPRPVCSIPSGRCALTLGPEAGAQCIRSARWDLCGGRPRGRSLPQSM